VKWQLILNCGIYFICSVWDVCEVSVSVYNWYCYIHEFRCNVVDRLYKEKITQVIDKLKEVESGVASEYLNPIAQLEDNRRIRVTVAGKRHQLISLRHLDWFLHLLTESNKLIFCLSHSVS